MPRLLGCCRCACQCSMPFWSPARGLHDLVRRPATGDDAVRRPYSPPATRTARPAAPGVSLANGALGRAEELPLLSRVGFISGLWAAQWHILGHTQPTLGEWGADPQQQHERGERHLRRVGDEQAGVVAGGLGAVELCRAAPAIGGFQAATTRHKVGSPS